MNFRLWYPQLDIYDTTRRMSLILGFWKKFPLTIERFYITDFYLANPPLLHNTQMPSEVRKHFSSMSLLRPNKAFLSYPSPPILFSKMAAVQKEALQTLVGKGLIDLDRIKLSQLQPSMNGSTFFATMCSRFIASEEQKVLDFLTTSFAEVGQDQPGGLRSVTGLRRIAA